MDFVHAAREVDNVDQVTLAMAYMTVINSSGTELASISKTDEQTEDGISIKLGYKTGHGIDIQTGGEKISMDIIIG